MKVPCEVIQDLLPLYADEACSEESGRMVREHLQECGECGRMLERLKSHEIEEDLKSEKADVIEYGEKRFRKRTATVGSTVSGVFMIPILACLIINLLSGSAMGWFFIVLAAMAVAASLIIVPLTVPRDKAFWTFCAFTGSLILLLAVTCLVGRGNWFWVASSAVLFGLGVIFLPFVIRAKPLQKWVGGLNRAVVVLAADGVLFLNMMNTIRLHGRNGNGGFLMLAGLAAGVALVVMYVMNNGRESK